MSITAERSPQDQPAAGGHAPRTPARDPLRDEGWFAEQIGKSLDWCRRNRGELPHHIVGETPRYDDHCVDLYRDQTFHPAVDPMTRSAVAQRRAARRR